MQAATMSGKEHGAPHLDPSQMLLGLPDIACQSVLQHLVSSGSKGIKELMTASKATRNLVLQHAHRITYTPMGHCNHNALHQAAGRKCGTLCLRLDLQQCAADEVTALFEQAAGVQGAESASHADGTQAKAAAAATTAGSLAAATTLQSGWSGVTELIIWVGTAFSLPLHSHAQMCC